MLWRSESDDLDLLRRAEAKTGENDSLRMLTRLASKVGVRLVLNSIGHSVASEREKRGENKSVQIGSTESKTVTQV